MSHWLIDPTLLTMDNCQAMEQASEFALRASALSEIDDAYIGVRSFAWLMEEYTGNWPGQDLAFPVPELTQAVQRLLPQIFSRILHHKSAAYSGICSPDFVGPADLRPEVLSDVAASVRSEGSGVVSSPAMWRSNADHVTISVEGKDELLPLIFGTNGLSSEVEAGKVRRHLSKFRLRIVGDRFRQDVCDRISAECGIQVDPSDWIASEKKKVPRDLGKRWGSLSPETDIAICITGRIGHETSGIAETCGKVLGRQYLEVELARDIPAALLALGQDLQSGIRH